MTEKILDNFNLKQIADSGQCFRMHPCSDAAGDGVCSYYILSSGHFLKISQNHDQFLFDCPEEDMAFWDHYFDLDTDYAAMIRSIAPKDRYLTKAAEYGSGIRILRQDPWEMIITFIISQQKTIPAIQNLVESLSRKYGTRMYMSSAEVDMSAGTCCREHSGRCLYQPDSFYTFPSPEQLNQASLEDLLELKLGYRAKYIKKVCEDACAGTLDLKKLSSMDYEKAMEYLQSFYGIGEKVANCICLFGLHHIDAFPVDTWIRKILMEEYAPGCREIKKLPQSRVCETLIKKYFSRYKGYAGVMQQYIFFYARNQRV